MKKNVKFLENLAKKGNKMKEMGSLHNFGENKSPKYHSLKNKQFYFVKKIQNGMFEETISILEALNTDLRISILCLDEFDLYHSVINYLSFEKFQKLVNLLPKEMIKMMVFSKKGMGFATTIYKYSVHERKGIDFMEDFCKKIDFFLEIDKDFFYEVFKNLIDSVKTKKILEYFHKKIEELGEKDNELLFDSTEKEFKEKFPNKKLCTEEKKKSLN